MNSLAWKWIGVQDETVAKLFEPGIFRQQVSGQLPELLVKPIQHIVALYSHLFHDFLIEVVEEFLLGIPLPFGNMSFQFTLELVELELDLLRGTALLVDGRDAFFKVDSRSPDVLVMVDYVVMLKLMVQGQFRVVLLCICNQVENSSAIFG